MIARQHRSRTAGTVVAGAIVAALLAAAAADPSWSADRTSGGPRAAVGTAGFAWSPVRVRELIGLVERSRLDGLDPEDYGLAALRSELELAEDLWGTPGSRQLDTLARASALALAADYRRTARGSTAALGPQLDAALATGSLGSWLVGNRASFRSPAAHKGVL